MKVDPKLYTPTAQRRAKRNSQVPPVRSPTQPPRINPVPQPRPMAGAIFSKRDSYVIAGLVAAVVLLSAAAAFA